MVERMERGGDIDEYEVQDQINPRTGEKVGQRMKLKAGTTLGFEERDWNHKGEPVEFVGEEKDYGDGTASIDYGVRMSNGRIATYRQVFERTSDQQMVSRGARRIFE
jgi:hypothetical protein